METQDLEEEEKKDINPALPDEGEFEEMERKREIKLPKRPIPATSLNIGKSVTVVTNYFKVEKPSDVIIHEYSISSQPPAYSNHRKLKRAIYLTLNRKLKDLLGLFTISGFHLLSRTEILEPIREKVSVSLEEGAIEQEYLIIIQKTSEIVSLMELKFGDTPKWKTNQIVRLLSIELKEKMKKAGKKQANRSSKVARFYEKFGVSAPNCEEIEFYTGYHVPCKFAQIGFVAEISTHYKIIRKDNLLQYLDKLYTFKKSVSYLNQNLTGQVVRAKYGTERFWRIAEIDFKQTPLSTFYHDKLEKEITYKEYFHNKYQINIQNDDQPLILNVDSKTETRTYLVPELLAMTGITEEMRRNRTGMQSIMKFTQQSPQMRKNQTKKLVSEIGAHETPWKTQLNPEEIQVRGFQLNPETLLFGQRMSLLADVNCTDFKMVYPVLEPSSIKTWILFFHENDRETALNFNSILVKVSTSLGIVLSNPIPVKIPHSNFLNIHEILKEKIKSFSPDIVVTLLPEHLQQRENERIYRNLKRVTCLESAVAHQNVKVSSIRPESRTLTSVCTKILMQMNAKLGGALWATKPPKRIPITIVIGIDICHQLNKHGKPMSFLGFCASLDCNFTEFYSKAYPIPSNQELVDGLQSCFEQFLLAFITKFEDIIPALIIVYRDGVSDTQQPSVVDYEVPQITDYIQSLQHTKWDPKIIYIIVNKRVNARFYLEIDEGENTREIRGLEHFQEPFISNPNPGTIIDSGIVTSSYDFYLISQSSTRGTITPTHYHVVYNTSQLHPQKLYQLTYKLCFHYYNWCGTIRVPAPCQYAHKLAFLASNFINHQPSEDLKQNLYYL